MFNAKLSKKKILFEDIEEIVENEYKSFNNRNV